MNVTGYTNSSGRKILQYFPPDSLMIDLPFILTQSKIMTRRMPYMLLEKKIAGDYIAAVRLIDFHERMESFLSMCRNLQTTELILCRGIWNIQVIGGFGH